MFLSPMPSALTPGYSTVDGFHVVLLVSQQVGTRRSDRLSKRAPIRLHGP